MRELPAPPERAQLKSGASLGSVVGRDHEALVRRQVGRSIVLLRTERELSQSDLADRADISKSYLSQIEAGHRLPSAQVLEQLARALDVPAAEISSRADVYPAAGAALGILFGGAFVGLAAGAALGATRDALAARRGRKRCDDEAEPQQATRSRAREQRDEAATGLLHLLSQLTPDELERVEQFARTLVSTRPPRREK